MGRSWVAALGLAACYGPHAQPGGACANGLCPSGLACIAGVCTDQAPGDASTTRDAPRSFDAHALDAPPKLAIRIDIAGPAYTGVEYPGTWLADPGICDGNQFDSPTPGVNGTVDDTLFVNQKFAPVLTCIVPNVPPGTYQVTLLFAELRLGGAPCVVPVGQERIFDIALEGTNVATGFDMTAVGGGCAADGGTGHAFAKSYVVSITDGALDVVETASMGAAALDAIEVVQQ